VLQLLGFSKIMWWDPGRALYSIILITAWQWVPFSIFVLLAGIRGIRQDVIEATQVDGANYWLVFRKVVFPMLKPLIMIIILLRTMWLIRLFDPLYGTTRGGVGTETLDWFVYRINFVFFDIGVGSTMAFISLFLTIIVCAVMFRFLMNALEVSN
jgi:multiple sugar transport system permease protein